MLHSCIGSKPNHFSNLPSNGTLASATVDLGLLGNAAGGPFSTQLVCVGDDYNEANQSAAAAIITNRDYRVLVGNRKWIKEKNFIDIPPVVEDKMLSQEKLGHTALLVAVDGNNIVLH